MARNNLRNAVKLALAVNAGIVGLSAAPGVLAQEGEAEQIEEIVTTGSRIKKQDYVSNAPVATVGFEQIELTGTINTESLLNTLPQTVPGLDRTSNNPGNGTATVDLRGLGTNRTLVLINGKRAVPTTSGGTVDINNIPNALIEQIEVLTGGASAVYGSDAVAGVVNFILKDDFEGLSIDAGYETTESGDAALASANLTMGANTADGRGNVTFNVGWTDREELFQGDRDFAFFAQFDDTDGNGNPILIDGGSSGIPATSIFSAGFDGFSPSLGVTFEPDGSIRPFETTGDNDFYNYAPVNYIQLPQTRYQATALGKYEIADSAEVYGQVMFTQSKVPQQLAPTPIFQTTQFTIDGNPFMPLATQQELSNAVGDGVDANNNGIDDTGTAFLRRRLLEVGPRIAESSSASYQLTAGLRGDINESWDYDVYYSYGTVNFDETQFGNVSRERWSQALLLDVSDPNNVTCTNPAAGAATVGCAPLNIWGEGNISDQAAEFLRTSVSSTADYEQANAGLNITGELFDLPGGAVGVAFGFEHRDDDFSFRPSQDLATGNIAGFNGSPAVAGGYTVTEYYVEAYLPILSGVTGAELLDLELAFRSSDYSTIGSVETYKVGASWAPVDSFRIRGGFNRAVRAPNIGELFAPQAEGFPGATDPCSGEAADQSQAVADICLATGVPANVLFSPAINLPAGQVRGIFGGNPNLQQEVADTFTAGVVFTPSFAEGLSLSIDYFDIEIDDAIAAFGGGASNVLNTCYDPADPTGGAGSDFCNVITRRADGTIESVEVLSQNVALVTLNGIDIVASYDTELWGGDLRLNYIATFTEESDFLPFDGAEVIECAGKFGSLCGEPVPDYKHRTTFNWGKDNYSLQLSWRMIGSVDDDDDGTEFFVEKIGSEHYFDLAGVYEFTDNYRVTFGIDNLADTTPPILGDNQEQANTWPATYDVFGRTYFFRLAADF